MNTITRAKLEQLHRMFHHYRQQNMDPADCIFYAARDMGFPTDFCIDDYTIIEEEVKE